METLDLIEKDNLDNLVYKRIVTWVLDGTIKPGDKLKIDHIAERLGVSHLPIRVALKKLEAKGILDVISGRTLGLPKLSKAKLLELYQCRIAIETGTSLLAASQLSNGELISLKNKCTLMSNALKNRDHNEFINLNKCFHYEIYEKCQSDKLIKIIQDLWLQTAPYFNTMSNREMIHSNTFHINFVDMCEQKKFSQAAQEIRNDLESALNVLLENINE